MAAAPATPIVSGRERGEVERAPACGATYVVGERRIGARSGERDRLPRAVDVSSREVVGRERARARGGDGSVRVGIDDDARPQQGGVGGAIEPARVGLRGERPGLHAHDAGRESLGRADELVDRVPVGAEPRIAAHALERCQRREPALAPSAKERHALPRADRGRRGRIETERLLVPGERLAELERRVVPLGLGERAACSLARVVDAGARSLARVVDAGARLLVPVVDAVARSLARVLAAAARSLARVDAAAVVERRSRWGFHREQRDEERDPRGRFAARGRDDRHGRPARKATTPPERCPW
ncbi:MAG: hypothetical protein KF795_21460 [Labilithrix sp.]|nr:hypothetical protein [Labilithrix sp.]